MRRILPLTAALLALAGAASAVADDGHGGGGASNAANRASATGVGQLTVINAITVTQTQGLDFGAVTSGQAGTVQIAQATGARSVTGGVGAVAANPGQAGAFSVKGQLNAAINVLVGANITGFGGGLTGTTLASGLPSVLTGGAATFSVGGVLSIPANTPAGAYTGSYTVAVNYP